MILRSALELKKKDPWIFLGGPCQGSENWQERFSDEFPNLPVVFCNPRREDLNDYNEQIEWERTHLEASDVLCFWFPPKAYDIPGRDYGQTTRYELGEWITKSRFSRKSMIIGIDQSIPGRRYFLEKIQDVKNISLVSTFEELLKTTEEVIKDKLYGSEIWFTSDTHFGSERTRKLSRRPFQNVKDMDWSMIRNWNSIVRPGDTVYHLGDFGDSWALDWLNGDIKIIPGNYENPDGPLKRVLLKIGEYQLCLSHKPSDSQMPGSNFSLFGHTHGRQTVKDWPALDVGQDSHHFRPVSFEDIKFWYEAITKHYDSENFL